MKIRLFFIFFLLCYKITAQQTRNLEKIGNYSWVKNPNNKAPEKLNVKIENHTVEYNIVKKTSTTLYSKKVNPETKIIKNGATILRDYPVTFIGKPLKYDKKTLASPFLFKDNSKANITYTDKSHGFVADGVISLTEDDKHNIWMITYDGGLVKYDGINYWIYNRASGLDFSDFGTILFDKKTGIWVTSSTGFFVIKNDSCFIAQFNGFKNHEMKTNWVSKDNQGNIWVGTADKGAFRFNKNNTYSVLDAQGGLPNNFINFIGFDSENNIWISQRNGLIEVKKDKIIEYFGKGKSIKDNRIGSIFIDKDKIWIGTFLSSIICFDKKDTIQYSVSGNYNERVYDFERTRHGLWFTIYGKGLFNYNGKEITSYTPENGLIDSYCVYIFKDSNQNLWVSDLNSGISRLNENPLQFSNADFSKTITSINNSRPSSNNNRWFFQNGNLLTKETPTTFEVIKKSTALNSGIFHFATDGIENPDGSLWFGAYACNGIAYLKGNQLKVYDHSEKNEEEVILSVARSKDNKTWFGTFYFGMIYHNPTNNNFYQYSTTHGILSNFITCLQTDIEGNIWAGHEKGLQKFSNNQFQDFCLNGKFYQFQPTCFYLTKNGTQLVGTKSQGILLMKNGEVFSINTKSGLASNMIKNIIEDVNGKIWITTDKGIERAVLNNQTIQFERFFDTNYGLGINKIAGTSFLNDSGMPSWGLNKGVLNYMPAYENDSFPKPNFTIQGATINDKNINLKDKIAFYSNDNFLLNYTLKNWGHEGEFTQKYILINQSTKDTTEGRVAQNGMIQLSDLTATDYQLKILAKHPHQNYYSNPVYFTVKPFWYNTYWFRGLVLCLLGLYFYKKYKKSLNENEKLEREVERQTAIIRNEKVELEKKNQIILTQNKEKDTLIQEVHHRVKNNLQYINAMLQMQMDSDKSKGKQSTLDDSSRRINAMALVHEMLYSKDDIERVSAKEYLNELMRKLVDSTKNETQLIDFELKINDLKFDINTSVAIGMITSEVVSNAIKYAFKGILEPKITLSLAYDNAQRLMFYTIQDNGVGMNLENNRSGFGLQLIDIFVRQLEGEYELKNQNGLAFHFKIPFEFNEK